MTLANSAASNLRGTARAMLGHTAIPPDQVEVRAALTILSPDVSNIADVCDRAKAHLAAIRADWPFTIDPPTMPASGVRLVPQGRPPGDLNALCARRSVDDYLAELAAQIVRWRNLAHVRIARGDVPALTVLIARHVDWIGTRSPAYLTEMENTLGALADRLSRIASGYRVRKFHVWNCVQTTVITQQDGVESTVDCPGHLYAILRSTDELLPPELRCNHDRAHRWAAHEWLALGRRLWEVARAAEAAENRLQAVLTA